jgi:transposase
MKKLTKTGTSGKCFQSREGDELYVGIDVHKRSCSVAVWNQAAGAIVASFVSPPKADALLASLQPHLAHIRLVVYEAGPTGFSLARALRDHGLPVQVISAAHVPASPAESEKSDRLDAHRLARWAALGLLTPVHIPDPQQEADRSLLRRRDTTVKECQRAKIRIKMFLLYHGIDEPKGLASWTAAARQALQRLPLGPELRFVLDDLLADLEHFEQRRRQVEALLRQKARQQPHAAKVANLRTIPGVGLWTALTLVLELLCPERFERKEQVAKMLGLAPKVRATGDTRREMGRIRAGNEHIRRALTEASWQWIRHDGEGRRRYGRLVHNTANPKKAIIGTARQLGIIMWRMLVTGEPYRGAPAPATP